MNGNNYKSDQVNELDLRDAVWAILEKRKFLILVFFITVILIFFLSEFTFKPKYEATAQIIISESAISTELDERKSSSFQSPNIKSLVEIGLADNLLASIFQNQIADKLRDEYTFKEFKESFSIEGGTNVVMLTYLDADPQRAAAITTIWAEEFTVRLNYAFWVSEEAYLILVTEQQFTKQEWENAQAELEEYLPTSPQRSLIPQISQFDVAIQQYLQSVISYDIMIDQAKALSNRFNQFDSTNLLELSDQLSLLSIELRAIGGGENFQIQITDDTILHTFSFGDAQLRISLIISFLETRLTEIQNKLETVKINLVVSNAELEKEEFKIRKLTEERDLALNAYRSLSNDLIETRIMLSQEYLPFKLFGIPQPPEELNSSNSIIYAIAGGGAFVFAAIAYVLFRGWLGEFTTLKSKERN